MDQHTKVELAREARNHVQRILSRLPNGTSVHATIRMEIPLVYLQVIGGVLEAALGQYFNRVERKR